MKPTNPLSYAAQWIAAAGLAFVVITTIHSATSAQIERIAALVGGMS